MLLSSCFTKILYLAFPLIASAINADPDDVVDNQRFKVLHVELDAAEAALLRVDQKVDRLVYYVTNDGHAIMGDINLGLESEILKHKKNKGPTGSSRRKKHGKNKKNKGNKGPANKKLTYRDEDEDEEIVTVDRRSISIYANWKDNKWPDADFRYQYNDAVAETNLKPKFDQAISNWLRVAPFLKFTQLPTADPYLQGTIKIQYTEGQPACWAPIGWCGSCSEMAISLDANCDIAGHVHEIGHALGLHHEHQRPDRDQYMFFNCSALADYEKYGTEFSPCPGEPDKCCQADTCYGWACQFRHIDYLDSSGPFDIASVMMYEQYSFSAGFYPTLNGINGYTVPIWDHADPSPGDAQRLCDIYFENCKSIPPIDDQICGNGILEGTEECDDGNTVDGDKCSSKCTIEKIDNTQKCTLCNPSPLENKCDITTSCINTQTGSHPMCACRAGYKANPGYDATELAEWRLPFQGQEYRVFVKPGIICNELCENWASGGVNGVVCGEVATKSSC